MNINIKLKIDVPKFSLNNKEKIKSLDGEIWKKLGKLYSYNSIIACLNHEKNYKTAFGYKWEYE